MEMYIKQKHYFLALKRLPKPWGGGGMDLQRCDEKVDVFVLGKEMKGHSELIILAHDAFI